MSIDLHASIPSRTRLVSYPHGFFSYARDFPIHGHGIFSYAVGCSPYANLAFLYAPPRSPPAPPFPKPGFSLCSPVAACATIAPSLPHLPISNETEHSMYQNATKYSRAENYMYYNIAYQNRNITSQQNTTYHNIMPRSRWDGRGWVSIELGFWLHLARLDLFGCWPGCVPKGKSVCESRLRTFSALDFPFKVAGRVL